MCLIRLCPNEGLNLRPLKHAADIIVVAHEIDTAVLRSLLLPEFCRNRLELLDEGVAGIIAGDALRPLVDDIHLAGRVVIEPRADVLFRVRRDGIAPPSTALIA